MGVAYMSNCTAKPIKTVRSLYLVVSDEMIMPKPSPIAAIMSTSTGIINKEKFIGTKVPLKEKKIITAINNKNCIPNFTRLEVTTDKGITSRGKYTFPNMPALATKVLDVLVRHEEK